MALNKACGWMEQNHRSRCNKEIGRELSGAISGRCGNASANVFSMEWKTQDKPVTTLFSSALDNNNSLQIIFNFSLIFISLD